VCLKSGELGCLDIFVLIKLWIMLFMLIILLNHISETIQANENRKFFLPGSYLGQPLYRIIKEKYNMFN
jgi:hypothetical protein